MYVLENWIIFGNKVSQIGFHLFVNLKGDGERKSKVDSGMEFEEESSRQNEMNYAFIKCRSIPMNN